MSIPGAKTVWREDDRGARYVHVLQLDAHRGLGTQLARVKWEPNIYGDWALSPDGTEVAIPSHPLGKARIRVIALDDAGGLTEREIVVETPTSLNGLNLDR